MQSLQKFLPKYSIALAVVFIATVFFLMTKGNTVDIEVEQVRNAELVQAIYATGFVEADAVANLSAEFTGTVSYVGALEGQHVTAGQKILQFSSPQPQLALREAKAALAEQQAQTRDNKLRRARKKNLFSEGAISRQELDEAEKNSVQAEEMLQQKAFQLKMREDDLKKLTVNAPFSGTLTLQNVKEGDYVTANTLVARVVDTSSYIVMVEVDELDIPRIRNGQMATVAFDAYPDKRLSAVVSRIVPQTDRVTKTSKIYLALRQPVAEIQAGMTATANIIYNIRPNALLVRKSSLFEENRLSYVWKIENGRLKKQPIRIGASDMTFVEVLQGLKTGDKIALVPEKNLHEGMEVKIISARKS
ncbi:MAG: efflux RND transporter periplasmic adaptor subunit [Chlorobiaceae bacterium]|jgi:membrane fusion protein, multidrug efflux system|nr:efflux RND transporter periplasmic adaptor subunit [Chlorobiaceae bacterium]NTV16827.1 efflux RND transporter periplasmic adaptor subunit [Chlorobiaceae bacterium]